MGAGENLGNVYWNMSTTSKYHELEVDFFNYYLKDQGEGNFNEAYIFMTGENDWKEYSSWPPKDVQEETIYFTHEGTETKGFNTQDGFGIRLLKKIGVDVGLVTARCCEGVWKRADTVGLQHVYQGVIIR